MKTFNDNPATFIDAIQGIREIIITNIILLGQIPAPTFQEHKRIQFLLERFAEFQTDEASVDDAGNAIAVIHGQSSETLPPIFLTAHVDTFIDHTVDHNISVTPTGLVGPALSDNSVSVGVLASLPEILRRLNLTFQSDIVLAGVVSSIGRGNLQGIRNLLTAWPTAIRGGICMEGVQIGRLNYYADAMIRGEIHCLVSHSAASTGFSRRPVTILAVSAIIDQILRLRLPQKPPTRIIIGKISGGYNHGETAFDATIGFEIRGDDSRLVAHLFEDIADIVHSVGRQQRVQVNVEKISHLFAAALPWRHPLVKTAAGIIQALHIDPVSEPSESDLSVFLSRQIPAITVGLTRGEKIDQQRGEVDIGDMIKGVAQVIALVQAIDNGVCDDTAPMD